MWATEEAELSVERPCLWPIVGDCSLQADQQPELVEAANQMAIDILHAASGRQFGECVVTYQPCRRDCAVGIAPLNMWEVLDIRSASIAMRTPWDNGYYSTMVCSNCAVDDCGCADLVDIQLWHRNVTSIMDVTVDGVTLAPSAYRLWRNRLVRIDGGAWPECQDATVANGEIGTWSVSYRHGLTVPYGGRVAAGILACEIAKALCGDTSCALPKRVQSVTRQGVSVAFLDPQDFLAEGKTGIYAVDLWLHQVNPNRLARRARAYSPTKWRRSTVRDDSFDPFPAP
jgi:hypothetical protein